MHARERQLWLVWTVKTSVARTGTARPASDPVTMAGVPEFPMPRDKMLPLRTPKLELLALQPIPVRSPDGLTLAAYTWGNPDGR